MINTLLEHVPIKLESKEDEKEAEEEDSSDSDTKLSEESEEEEESDADDAGLEADEVAAATLISSDEEAELEAQRIRFHELLLGRKLLQKKQRKDKQLTKQEPKPEPEPQHQQQQQMPRRVTRASSASSSGSSSVVLVSDKETAAVAQRRGKRRTYSTCSSVASSLTTPASETESCGNIFVCAQTLIFHCGFCDLRYGELAELSRHQHTAHKLFQEETPQPTVAPPARKSARNQAKAAAAVVKKELNYVPEADLADPTPLPHSDVPLESCGNIFVLNRKKLFLICGYCQSKYANVPLFHKHLRQQHDLFSGPTPETHVQPKHEIKTEVFIITELAADVEEAPASTPPQPMVAIPEGMQLDNNDLMDLHGGGGGRGGVGEVVAQAPETPPPEVEEIEAEKVVKDKNIDAETQKVQQQVVVEEEVAVQTVKAVPEPKASTVREEEELVQALEEVLADVLAEDETLEEKQILPVQRVLEQKAPIEVENQLINETVVVILDDAKQAQKNEEESQPANGVEESAVVVAPATAEEESVEEVQKSVKPAKRKRKRRAVTRRSPSKRKKVKVIVEKEEDTTTSTATAAEAAVYSKNAAEIVSTRVRRTSAANTKSYKAFFTAEAEASPPPSAQQQPPSSPESAASSAKTTTKSAKSVAATVGDVFTIIATASDEDDEQKPSTAAGSSSLLQLRFTCDHCPKSFAKSSRLAEHKRLHTGEKPFGCDECGKHFRIKMRLTEHQLRHRKDKLYKCDTCGMAMSTRQDLTLHQRHHSGDRRYACEHCPKAFVRSGDLKTHLRIHTGEKPFVCDICNKCFRANPNLIVHRRSHTGVKNFKCEFCEKSFMRNIDRKVHTRTHTGEKPFKCEICQRGYSSRVHVRAHIEREHVPKSSDAPPRERKKPGPKPKHLREQLAKQKELIDELQLQLMRQIKTDEKHIPQDDDEPAGHDDEGDYAEVPPPPQQQQQRPLNSPKLKRKSTPTLTIMQKIEQHSSPPSVHGMQQVSVTVSMQVENVPVAAATANQSPGQEAANSPHKENVALSSPQLTAAGVKKERNKITSYFTVVGQKTEI